MKKSVAIRCMEISFVEMKMRLPQLFWAVLTAVFLGFFSVLSVAAPDIIFHGGAVITMAPDDSVAEALAVENGRIVAVGDRESVLALAGESTKLIDLKGAPLLPGFVDSHSHANFIGLQAMSANLLPPPDGGGASVADVQNILREYMKSEPNLERELGWVIGFGYDDSQLAEKRHPTRQDMDAVSTEVPILLIHQSGHFGVANSLGLKLAGIGPDTPNPEGGIFRREDDGKQPNGVAEEYAFFRLIYTALAKSSDALQDQMAIAGSKAMASYGYTTAQEGRANPEGMVALKRVAERGEFDIDLVAYPDMLTLEDVSPTRTYSNRLRTGGVKLTIDGSPQGKTAWLSHAYHVPPDGQDDGYLGYPAIDVETVNSNVLRAFENDWQILVHSNGDAATDALLNAVTMAREKYPDKELRPVLIHGQVLRKDQVAALDELDIFPSLFPMHTFYWGDWHRDSVLGPERAENISPTGWVLERGMMFGSHHDAPVANPDSMRVLAATVTRTTRSGRVLGPEHRVDVMTGLRALTIWPAWQHFEELSKGSLEVGKLADLVVLSENPLRVDPSRLADLEILTTYKEGKVVYQQPQ